MMGNLFSRGQSISDIYALSYEELKYWNGWHELMAQAEKDAFNTGKK